MIAFFGMGLLGANFVRAMRRRGEEVRVFNRTFAKAKALEEVGAKPFEDPAEAVRGAERVHLTLSDDAAVDAVLEAARPGLAKGTILVDHTTTSPGGAAARAARWAERGMEFLHAPVFMGPPNALAGTGIMLVSGPPRLVEHLKPALAKMTGKVLELGPEPDRAAAFKLLGNAFLMFLTSGLGDVLKLARAMGVAPKDAGALFDHFNPGAMVPARLERILGSQFADASWELAMARKDARLMLDAAAAGGVTLDALPAIAATMDRFLAAGHAHDDWTIIASEGVAAVDSGKTPGPGA